MKVFPEKEYPEGHAGQRMGLGEDTQRGETRENHGPCVKHVGLTGSGVWLPWVADRVGSGDSG